VRGARVRVDGEVLRPATYEAKGTEQLAELLKAAGGLRPTAATQRLLVERVVPGAARTGLGANRTAIDVSLTGSGEPPAFQLADGDVIRVARIDDRMRNRITVAGHVFTPGTQGFTAGLTLEQALKRAGGLKADAYLGRVLVSRLNADSTRTQLRAMLRDTTGATVEPLLLQPDDEITAFSRTGFRPERYVAVAGAVQQGGRFPYRDGMTLRDLVLEAGGLTELAELRVAEIARRPDTTSAGKLAETLRVPLDSGFLFAEGRAIPAGTREEPLKPFDNVVIFPDPDRRAPSTVRLTGEVQYPGSYTLRSRNERLAELLNRAGGITSFGDASAAYVSRRTGESRQVERLVQGAAQVRNAATGEVTRAAASDSTKLEEGGARIRLGVDVEKALRDGTARDNLFLTDGDSIHVPARQQTVTVRGEVNAPTALVASGKGIGAYIAAAGGKTATGNTRGAYVIQPNGKIETRSHLLWVFTLDPEPKPGATVVVPAKADKASSGSFLQTFTVIVQSLAALATARALLQ
jgi:protein involved in polysaccharide export with SLBB domain